MARSVRACGVLGLFFVQFSMSCSPSTGVAPGMSYGGQGTGSTPSTGAGGSSSSSSSTSAQGGGGFVPNTDPITTDTLSGLQKSCGNGQADNDDEKCDDGNTNGGDGCTKLCQLENPNEWSCPRTGACTSTAVCGNGSLSSQEACDDGNATDGDGCSADCKNIEDGWQCRMAGKKCIPKCGDGQIKGDEQCEDGNTDNGDGCSSTCILEPGFDCSSGTCKEIVCGDGVRTGAESCDVGKEENGLFYGDGTGCSKTCTKEPVCTRNSTAGCEQVCGDGNKAGSEECDDGNNDDGDGCSANCTSEEGFSCSDKTLSDAEDCPSKSGSKCLVLPVIYRDFEGQQINGGHPDFFYYGASASGGRKTGVTSGASKTTCVPNAMGTQGTWTDGSSCLSDDDQVGPCKGLAANLLDSEGKPVMAKDTCHCVFTDWDRTGLLGTCPTSGTGDCTIDTSIPGVKQCWVKDEGSQRLRIEGDVKMFQSAQSFEQWYRDSDYSTNVHGRLELIATSGNQYQFSSSVQGDPAGTPMRTTDDDLHDICLAANHTGTLKSGFFPLEDAGGQKVCNMWPYWLSGFTSAAKCCAGTGCPVMSQWDAKASYDNCPTVGTGGPVPKSDGTGGKVNGVMRNFYFTTEVRYLFRYDGGTGTLQFHGDDDVWVFINGILALDLGGTHKRLSQSITINASTYKLTSGNTYEIAVFHADRNPRDSNYQLTLTGFSTVRTQCRPTCGDGKTTAGEECDLGVDPTTKASLNTGEYNGCNADCTYGPFCGDEVQNGNEECDHGRNNGDTYGKDGCTGDCRTPHYCGDGSIDGLNGEECDDKVATSTCTDKCKLILGSVY